MQRKNLVWIGIFFVVLLAFLIVPLVVKGKIQGLVKTQIDKNIDARVEWGDLSVRWMKDFPSFTVSINDIGVLGQGVFSKDTLLTVDNIVLSVNFMNAIQGEQLEISRLSVESPVLNIIERKDSLSNLDVFKLTKNKRNGSSQNSLDKNRHFLLKQLRINNGQIIVNNARLGLQGLLSDINVAVLMDDEDADIQTQIKKITLNHNGINYIDSANVDFRANLERDKANLNRYIFRDNSLFVNKMNLAFAGSFAPEIDCCDFDLSLRSVNSSFSSVFDLFPQTLFDTYGELESDGSFTFNTDIKGKYQIGTSLPGFNLNMSIDKGAFHFSKQEGRVVDLNVNLDIHNTFNTWDSTVVNLSQFHFSMADKPFDASVVVTHPLSKVDINGNINGVIDFDELQKAVPFGKITIGGLLESDLKFVGTKKQIQEGKLDELVANGSVVLHDFYYHDKSMLYKLAVSKGQIIVEPNTLELKDIKCKYGHSDLMLRGKVQNYLSFLFGDGTLSADIVQQSDLFVLNDFLHPEKKEENKKPQEETEKSEIIKVPDNMDCTLKMKCAHLQFDNLDAKNLRGVVKMKDGILMMDKLNMNLLKGNILLSGTYSTQDSLKPSMDLDFNAKSIDLKETAHSFHFVQKILPGAENTKGKVTLDMHVKSDFTSSMKMMDNSIQGGGTFVGDDIEIRDSKVFDDMADMLNDDKYKVLKINNVKVDFTLGDGKLKVEPFSAQAFDKTFHIQGEHGFDKSLNYIVTAPVTGTDVAVALGFPKVKISNKEYPVDVFIKGTSDDPKVNLDFSKAQKMMEKDISNDAENVIKDLLKDDKIKKSINDFFKGF